MQVLCRSYLLCCFDISDLVAYLSSNVQVLNLGIFVPVVCPFSTVQALLGISFPVAYLFSMAQNLFPLDNCQISVPFDTSEVFPQKICFCSSLACMASHIRHFGVSPCSDIWVYQIHLLETDIFADPDNFYCIEERHRFLQFSDTPFDSSEASA